VDSRMSCIMDLLNLLRFGCCIDVSTWLLDLVFIDGGGNMNLCRKSAVCELFDLPPVLFLVCGGQDCQWPSVAGAIGLPDR
jgi:hypothetical protein